MLLHGFDRYFQQLIAPTALGGIIPSSVVIVTMVVIMSLIAFRGIKESAIIAVILTVIEALDYC